MADEKAQSGKHGPEQVHRETTRTMAPSQEIQPHSIDPDAAQATDNGGEHGPAAATQARPDLVPPSGGETDR